MIKLENTDVVGWEHAIRGMRNPMNSWERSDSGYCYRDLARDCTTCIHRSTDYPACYSRFDIGPNDYALMMNLANGGPVHAKYRRMIVVYVDILAPLYWWKEFDTYKVGTVANSCSTMHKIAEKEFDVNNFSHEHVEELAGDKYNMSYDWLLRTVDVLNYYRKEYNITSEKLKRTDLTEAERKHTLAQQKLYWRQMIQLLPSSYNQRRTVMLNYEVLHNIYISRKNHKLDEWHTFCDWIESLPYSEIIIGEENNK